MSTKKEIQNIQDIELLVNTFYSKVKKDEILGYIFNEIAEINWVEHLPKMYNFWDTILFGSASFKGNPMLKHLLLSAKAPMGDKQFNQWLHLWGETIDELFEGEKAEEAKIRANSIKQMMSHKIAQHTTESSQRVK